MLVQLKAIAGALVVLLALGGAAYSVGSWVTHVNDRLTSLEKTRTYLQGDLPNEGK